MRKLSLLTILFSLFFFVFLFIFNKPVNAAFRCCGGTNDCYCQNSAYECETADCTTNSDCGCNCSCDQAWRYCKDKTPSEGYYNDCDEWCEGTKNCCEPSNACAATTACGSLCYDGCGNAYWGTASTCTDICNDCGVKDGYHFYVRCITNSCTTTTDSCVYMSSCGNGDCHVSWDTCGGTASCLAPLNPRVNS